MVESIKERLGGDRMCSAMRWCVLRKSKGPRFFDQQIGSLIDVRMRWGA